MAEKAKVGPDYGKSATPAENTVRSMWPGGHHDTEKACHLGNVHLIGVQLGSVTIWASVLNFG
jgi:hypothetical protein